MERFQLKPTIFFGPDALAALEGLAGRRVMVITDSFLAQSGLLERVRARLRDCTVEVFDQVVPDPPLELVAQGARALAEFRPQAVVAFGGGSPMDCAKAMLEFGKKLGTGADIRFVAVPTTAGTGSETTIAAVVTGSDHHKYAISDLCLIPRYAILDPALTVGLPPHITAETGMDALTHAVEAYLNRDGTSLPDRAAMLQASFDAGAAFTRASVGNVHAIAHTLGGLYGVPHGLANAVLLPLVLEDYGKAAYPRLARLAALVGLKGESEESLAKAFIAEIRAMNARMGIPDHFNCIRKEDIPLMATWAAQEANPVYPVPVIYDEARFARVIERSHHSQ